MSENLGKQIDEEIARVKGEIDEQKRLIKKNVGKTVIIETAEAEMRALHTRLAVLEVNRMKHAGRRPNLK